MNFKEDIMIDFTNVDEEYNIYKGREKKKTFIYNEKKYLVKFPNPIENKNKNISYINNTYSEYIGSYIFRIIGMKVQNVVLGSYVYNDKNKIVCACEDFTDENNILVEFENFALSINPDEKIGTEINDIMKCLEEIKNLALNCYFILKINNNRINYMEFIKKQDNNDCNNAIKRNLIKLKLLKYQI